MSLCCGSLLCEGRVGVGPRSPPLWGKEVTGFPSLPNMEVTGFPSLPHICRSFAGYPSCSLCLRIFIFLEIATRFADVSGRSPIHKLGLINLEPALEKNTRVYSLNHPPKQGLLGTSCFSCPRCRGCWKCKGCNHTTYRNRPNLRAQDFKTFKHATLTSTENTRDVGLGLQPASHKKAQKPGFFRYFLKETTKNRY